MCHYGLETTDICMDKLYTENASLENVTASDRIWEHGPGDLFGVVDFSILVIIIPCALAENLLVLVAMIRFKKLRTCMNLLIMNLAIGDLLVGFPTGPIYAGLYIYEERLRSKWLCLVKSTCVIASFSCSLISLFVISIDRYLVVLYPLHYNTWVTKRRIKIAIAAIWSFIVPVSIMPLLGVNTWDQTHACEYYDLIPKPLTVFLFVIIMGVCFPAATILYIRITCEIRKVRKRIRVNLPGEFDQKKENERKAGAMMAFIFLLFVIFWLPFAVAIPLRYLLTDWNPISNFKNLTVIIAMGNSVVNPIVYSWCKEELRTAFINILLCRRQRPHRQCTSIHSQKQKKNLNTKTVQIFSVL